MLSLFNEPEGMINFKIREFPHSRIASMDVCEIGKQKHHIIGLVEFDVTDSRIKIKQYNYGNSKKISFNAWLISVISRTLISHDAAGSYMIGKNKCIVFKDINVSIVVEKVLNEKKIPIPLIIEKANEINIEAITAQISDAKNQMLSSNDMVLQKRTRKWERLYYMLPRMLRIYFWKYLLKHPKWAYKKMGNVAITSVGMMGEVNGWFIPISIHPICFGISSIIRKPVVIGDRIEIREVLNVTVLMDHDVIDGAPMARFISDLKQNIENGFNL